MMNEDIKHEVTKIIEDDVIKYMELAIKSEAKPETKAILEEFKLKKINMQEVLFKLNEIKEFELSKKLYNMINMHQKNYHHIIGSIGRFIP